MESPNLGSDRLRKPVSTAFAFSHPILGENNIHKFLNRKQGVDNLGARDKSG